MAKMTLLEAHVFEGRTYGPGEVELPELPRAVMDRLRAFEEEAKYRNNQALGQLNALLPAGHPYRQMFVVNNVQPPEYDGPEPATLGSNYFHASALESNRLMPDGWTVSGAGMPQGDQEAMVRGEPVARQYNPGGGFVSPQQFMQAGADLPVGQGAGELHSPVKPADVAGFQSGPNTTPQTRLSPEEASPTPLPQGSFSGAGPNVATLQQAEGANRATGTQVEPSGGAVAKATPRAEPSGEGLPSEQEGANAEAQTNGPKGQR